MMQKDTGWTDNYILWEVSWANLQMKFADQPRYVYHGKEKTRMINDEQELTRILEQLNKI